MIKLDSDYSDYTDMTDENFPAGKAVNASSSETPDGTPILASLINDIMGARQAIYKEAYGDVSGISGNPDNISKSDLLKALKYLIETPDALHAALRGENAHGATVAADPGQLIARSDTGTAQVASPVEDEDIVNKSSMEEFAAPINHASTDESYGVGTPSQYGHVKVRNDLTASSYADGEALSAYQGKVLSDAKADKVSISSGSAGDGNNATPGYGQGFVRPWFTVNSQGLITSYGTSTVTLPASDNTWRPVEDNLTSSSTSNSLSANQGRVLNNLIGLKLVATYSANITFNLAAYGMGTYLAVGVGYGNDNYRLHQVAVVIYGGTSYNAVNKMSTLVEGTNTHGYFNYDSETGLTNFMCDFSGTYYLFKFNCD